MKVREFTGRCSYLAKGVGLLVLALWAVPGVASEAEAAYDVEWSDDDEAWQLDPAIFTELSPITTADVAVKLPEDQQVDE